MYYIWFTGLKCTYWRIRCINKNKWKVWLKNFSWNDNHHVWNFRILEPIYNFHFLRIDLVLLRQVQLKILQWFVLNPLNVIKDLCLFLSVLNVQSGTLETFTWFLVNTIWGHQAVNVNGEHLFNCVRAYKWTEWVLRKYVFVFFRLDWRGWNVVFDELSALSW